VSVTRTHRVSSTWGIFVRKVASFEQDAAAGRDARPTFLTGFVARNLKWSPGEENEARETSTLAQPQQLASRTRERP